ncbi:malate dehydrogenase, mitochondrial-like [Eurosta solidaginis]|uniref:malate dehydrogenase, mitochondrial-like n=1 Tax=Eurosta solidaginis TaxID=178769 RepID=UPI0035311C68
MLRRPNVLWHAFSNISRKISTTQTSWKRVCVIGSNGQVGKTLSVLLKRDNLITGLTLYDVKGGVGEAEDISHMDTSALISGYEKPEDLPKALNCADIVILVAGFPHDKDSKDDDLLKKNSKIISEIMPHIANVCPKTLIAIVTSPVNSLVPMAAEVLKTAKAYDPNRLFGVTTPHVVRARTFVADLLQVDASRVYIPVIGGNSMCTVLPILSHAKPRVKIEDEDDVMPLIRKVREADDVIMKVKKGPATLMIAHAVAKFTHSLLMGLSGIGDTVECAFVESKVIKECKFFATPLQLGKDGIKENLGLPSLHRIESDLLKEMLGELQESIKKGIDLAKKK